MTPPVGTKISGDIKYIANESTARHAKKTVVIANHLEGEVIQFNGKQIKLLNGYDIGDFVEVHYLRQYKFSNVGKVYSNHFVISITKL